MKTPILTYSSKRTAEVLDACIARHIQTVTACSTLQEGVDTTIRNMLYNLCYKIFYVDTTEYADGQNYTVADLCLPIMGMFQNMMIEFMHDIITAAQNYQESSVYKVILRNSCSYELIRMLYGDPTKVYACILYNYVKLNPMSDGSDCLNAATACLHEADRQGTLVWENMYNLYMERYESI